VRTTLLLVMLGVASTATGLARAQPREAAPERDVMTERPVERPLAAPRNALELSVGTGYTQGFGNLKSGVGMPSVATPGVAVALGIGYRIDPGWAVLWSGEYAQLTAERTNEVRSYTTGLAMQYHLAPRQQVDPWVEVGAGYRLLEESSAGPTSFTHGVQLVRVRAGVDLRIADAVALGPMLGADATYFVFQDIPGQPTTIDNPTVSTFLFGGLQGRFDIGQSTRSRRVPVVVSASARE
jgi:hypothetical protein